MYSTYTQHVCTMEIPKQARVEEAQKREKGLCSITTIQTNSILFFSPLHTDNLRDSQKFTAPHFVSVSDREITNENGEEL